MRSRSLCVVVASLLLVFSAALALKTPRVEAQSMSLPGRFAVSPTGAATYAIAIVTPPGTAGMLPSLSLAYSSQGGNGLLGVGWQLEGLPSIGRCARTVAQDGMRGSVNYDANDRFCMDGQRLIAITGTYGADGTDYRTEIESFAKIVSHGTAGTGPAWFEVKTKSGQILQFGNSADSRVLAQGKTTARDWAANKVSDTKGNYFTVTYINDTSNGQAYPSRIDYTGNNAAGLAPYNSVRFVYDSARPDAMLFYHAGSLQKTTVRLSNVQTYAGTTLVADYRLAYTQGSTTGRSQLTSVTLCDGAVTCLPATNFTWQNGTTTPSVVSNVAGQNGTLTHYRPFIGDFNGDGLPDILWDGQSQSPAVSTGTRVLWTATGGGNFTVTANVAGQDGTTVGHAPIVGDFNRDGKSDIWWYQLNSNGAVGPTGKWLSTSTGAFSISSGPLAPGGGKSGTHQKALAGLPDFNGDSRADLLWTGANLDPTTLWRTNVDGTISSTSHGGCSSFPGWSGCSLDALAADFNADGFSDILWVQISGGKSISLWLGDGNGAFTGAAFTGNFPSLASSTPYLLDVNGDGSTDVLWDAVDSSGRSTGIRILWLGKGDGTFVTQTNVSGQDGTLSGYRAYVGDFDGDGRADILWDHADSDGLSTGTRVLWQGKGDGTFTVISNFGGQDGTLVGYAPIIVDFNGDGKTDILWDQHTGSDSRSAGQRVLWLSDGVPSDLVTSVTTGIGATITATYRSLTDGTVYTKDTLAIDPIVDLQSAMHVVSRVDAGNGIGGTLSTTYAYAGAKIDLNGRGFLGFRQMTATDLQTNLAQSTTYRQDYPFTGLVASETRKLGTATLSTTSNIYGAVALGGTRFQVLLTQSQAGSSDLDGSVLPTSTSAYQYDAYGNATLITVSATDGFSKTTTNTYSNDTSNWFLGRLTNAAVASLMTPPGTPPGEPQVDVVISGSTYDLNLWTYLLSNGLATAGTPRTWNVRVESGVVIGSTSTSTPAFDTGLFPAGSTLTITNGGTIAGAGGPGGSASACSATPILGSPGGAAFRAQTSLTFSNAGAIWGGGGGGGGARPSGGGSASGGGGGAGAVPGAGGAPITPFIGGTAGTLSSGGAGGAASSLGGSGGGPGLPGNHGAGPSGCTGGSGGVGGAAGNSVTGNSLITWGSIGDRRGPVN